MHAQMTSDQLPTRHLAALGLIVALLGLPFWLVDHPALSTVRSITGVVRDERGPVSGATVRCKGSSRATLTDSAGVFTLTSESGRDRITASKPGYFIAGISTDVNPLILHLQPIPHQDCERYSWVDPAPSIENITNCANCHREIYNEWHASAHADSSRNRRFVNLYDGTNWHGQTDQGWNLLKEYPDGAGVCASCHGPTLPTADFDIRQATKSVPESLSGVHCDFCHKVAGPGPGEFGLTHGRYQLALRRPDLKEVDQLFFGPLDDVDRGDDTASAFQRNSQLCAACHEGVVFGVPVYTTYSEWLQSPARQQGKSCQSCHMAPTGKLTNFARDRGGIERDPRTLGNHRFFAGSQLAMLQKSIHHQVKTTRSPAGLVVEVQLAAREVGHRVPTGFIDRHLILHVEANRPLLDGPKLPSQTGDRLADKPGKIYGKMLEDENGRAPVPFWRADPSKLQDTRLEPGKTDIVRFLFPPETSAVRLQLFHRRFWSEVAESKSWPNSDLLILEEIVP
jgi:hypothetical protein